MPKMIVLTKRPDFSEVVRVEVDPENVWNPPAKEKLDAHASALAAGTPDDSPLGEVVFYLRSFTGEDQRAFSDKMLVSDRKGRSRMNAGEVQKEKLLRGVVRIENLSGADGRAIEKLSPATYASVPAWILNRVSSRMNEALLEDEEDEGN